MLFILDVNSFDNFFHLDNMEKFNAAFNFFFENIILIEHYL